MRFESFLPGKKREPTMKRAGLSVVKLLVTPLTMGAMLIGLMQFSFFLDWAPEEPKPPLSRTDFVSFTNALDQLLAAAVTSFNFQGQLAVANFYTHQTFKHYYGLQTSQQADFHRPYLLGSISKTITAILIAQLVDDGTLNEHDSYCVVMGLLCSEKASRITVKALLDHRSGLARLSMSPFFGNVAGLYQTFLHVDPKNSDLAALRTFNDIAPEPTFLYSNLGFRLLTYLLEQHYNAPFKTIVETQIAERYNLPSFTVADKESPQPLSYFPIGLTRHASILVPSDLLPLPRIASYGDGAVLASLNDLVMLAQRIVDRSLFHNQRTHNMLFDAPVTYSYANGLVHGTDVEGVSYLFHNGSYFGCETFFYVFPRQRIAVVMLSNMGYHRNEFKDFISALYNAIEGRAYEVPQGVRTVPSLNF